jgi:hypothetical protein
MRRAQAGGGWTYKLSAMALWNLNSWDAIGTSQRQHALLAAALHDWP